MSYTIQTRVLEEMPLAVVEGDVSTGAQWPWLQDAFAEITRCIAAAGIHPTGPRLTRFAVTRKGVHATAAVPVEISPDPAGRVTPGRLAGGVAVVAVHEGPYDDIAKAYDALQSWILEHGFEKADAHFESYLVGPAEQEDPALWRTEVVVPYRES
jgi:effector-binding domain-containing protein